jgi:hypothetical protein
MNNKTIKIKKKKEWIQFSWDSVGSPELTVIKKEQNWSGSSHLSLSILLSFSHPLLLFTSF